MAAPSGRVSHMIADPSSRRALVPRARNPAGNIPRRLTRSHPRPPPAFQRYTSTRIKGRALQCRLGTGILNQSRHMMMKFLQALSITALLLLIKRLLVRKPPSRPYRHPEDERSKIRGYRRPS